ncbi:MAG: primosomal protein N' [Pseudomonadota bacterium]
MSPPTIVQVALPVPLPGLFDYTIPDVLQPIAPGDRVLVPFGRRRLVGIVVRCIDQSDLPGDALKPLLERLGAHELPDELLALLCWTVRYYAAPVGELVALGLPPALRRARTPRSAPPAWIELTEAGRSLALKRAPKQRQLQTILLEGPAARADLLERGFSTALLRQWRTNQWARESERPLPDRQLGPELNDAQAQAVSCIREALGRYQAFLLAGVTGSGKTEVYLQAALPALNKGRQVLLLLPEIGLTTQTVRRIEARLGQPAWVYHSGLSEGERLATWQAARSGRARVLVGTRSALFLPLQEPGLIVVDEEHDGSYKQFDGVRYSARDVAIKRAAMLGIPIVLGSATPSLESVANADAGRYRLLQLPQRVTNLAMPEWMVEDTRGDRAEAGLSAALLDRIERRLELGEQVLIYRNRRGYAPVMMCNECGWQADCPDCAAHLTFHRARRQLRCHHCSWVSRAPNRCPQCQSPALEALGAGTERVEDRLRQLLADVPILRIDRDQVQRRDQFEQLMDQVAEGQPCVIVGTQMIAKGHHWPAIGLAVVLDADQSLFSADFRGPERLAQTLFQVSGRAGRAQPGEFILQTRQPDHPLIIRILESDYLSIARWLLAERVEAGLPPAGALAMIRAEARQADHAQRFLTRAAGLIDSADVQVSGPLPALLQRRAGYWRYQLWLRSAERSALLTAMHDLPCRISQLDGARGVRWHVDMDPQDL